VDYVDKKDCLAELGLFESRDIYFYSMEMKVVFVVNTFCSPDFSLWATLSQTTNYSIIGVKIQISYARE